MCRYTHTHTPSTRQIPLSAKKSINKCIVSSLSAVGISLSKLSEKAAECEIEFRTVRRVSGPRDERMFAYLFRLQQLSVAGASARKGQFNNYVVWCSRPKFVLFSKQGFKLCHFSLPKQ